MATALAVALPLFLSGSAGAADAGSPEKAQLCVACHGPEGNSTNPAVPSIAGQPAQFISTELFLFRQGSRDDPQMTAVAKTLSNTDMNELAAYFSAQTPSPPKHRTAPQNAVAGPELARRFNCVQCHGPRLLGQQHIPRLAGQQFDYLRVQLLGFKAHTRADIDGNMTSAAEPLTEKDIEVLVDYIAGLGTQ